MHREARAYYNVLLLYKYMSSKQTSVSSQCGSGVQCRCHSSRVEAFHQDIIAGRRAQSFNRIYSVRRYIFVD